MYIYLIELMDMYLYLRSGMTVKLNEEHVITSCQALNFEWNSLEVSQFLGHTRLVNVSRQLKDYLGGDNAPVPTMLRRAKIIHTLISTWLKYAGGQA